MVDRQKIVRCADARKRINRERSGRLFCALPFILLQIIDSECRTVRESVAGTKKTNAQLSSCPENP